MLGGQIPCDRLNAERSRADDDDDDDAPRLQLSDCLCFYV